MQSGRSDRAARIPAIANVDRLLETATEKHRAGDLAEARRRYGEVLAAAPAHPLALFRLGLLELQEQRLDAALERISERRGSRSRQLPLSVRPRTGTAIARALG